LGEAWARTLSKRDHDSPETLFAELSLQNESTLKAPCPSHVEAQCWSPRGEQFVAPSELLARVERHKRALLARGIEVVAVRCDVVCTKRLNQARGKGHNRFVVDLHAMESLLLSLRDECNESIDAICGKVGGIGEYGKFFGPLSSFLHAIIEESRARSAYHFPGLGKVCFERDADAKHQLVMLASLVGKYVRELLMSRVSRFYLKSDAEALPSGYHDPVTESFVHSTRLVRRQRRVPKTCFERQGGVIA
jgi:ribonuclease HII